MRRLGVVIAALIAPWAAPASAYEHITDFSSDIAVGNTGTLTVTETISVMAEGDSIRHGIFRVIPTRYTDRLGNSVHVGLSVASVTRDGNPEPYSIESSEDGRSIKIGDKDTLIDPGPHTYAIQYQTTRQIGFYKTYDELYWNVTGNFWKFPIDRAEARILLPNGGRIEQYALYTGAAGSNGKDAEADRRTDREIDFHTTRPLGLSEGLTVAVGFSKGAVLPPGQAELRREFLEDNAPSIIAWAAMIMLFIYYFIAWWAHGRDPKRGVAIPLFAPPKNFSPAAVRFVSRMAYDRKCYSASLVDMAVKKFLKIAEHERTYTLTRTGQGEDALSSGEAAIGRKLFARRNSIELKDDNHEVVAASISALKDSLENEYERVYFNTNLAWFVGGVAILIVGAVATALMCDDWATAAGALGALALASGAAAFLLHRAFRAWAGVGGPGSRVLNFLGAVFATIFAVPVAGALVAGVTFLTHDVPAAALAALVAGGIMSYAFYHLLKAPTLAGARILDEIEGFKMYLVTAEKARLEALNPPQVTPEVFERFLPYAIALDCENQWSKKFEAEAAASGIDPTAGGRGAAYVPLWYSGSSFDRLGTAGFTSALGSSIAAAAASAATPPGSSSGSGGGGFSGGGGGGGGGGGW